MILHDELKDDEEKRQIFHEYGLALLDSFILDENVWRDEYYGCLEKKLACIEDMTPFHEEMEEIAGYRRNPLDNRSIYYVLRKA